mmetsp:Transcript_16876/g.20317  ORF Transcript_16876/g.20317 Transcript_16876/m.20317 type:complete len:715 (+) Transcript_16876:403-2547(+)
MELYFSRNDIIQVSATTRNSFKVLPIGKKKQQKMVVGDATGVIQSFSLKKGEVVNSFKHLPTGTPIEAVCLGTGQGQKDKIFCSTEQTVKGFNKKGKEFFKFSSNLTEKITSLTVHELQIWTTGEYTYNMFNDCKDKHFYVANDRINDMKVVNVISEHEPNPLLGCQDHFVRLLQGSDLYYEASVDGPVRSVHKVKKAKDQPQKQVLYATSGGILGEMHLDTESVRRGWKMQSEAAHCAAVEVMNTDLDLTKDGVQDLIVGRDNGLVEMFVFDGPKEPKVIYKRSLNESVTSMGSGFVTDGSVEDLVVVTYSGKVIAFSQAGPDGQVLGDEKTSEKMPNDKKIKLLRREIEVLRERVEKEREKYSKVSDDLIAVNNTFHVNDKFVLDPSDASYFLTVETPMPIFTVALQSDVPVELLEMDSNVAILSVSPMRPEDGNFCIATYRCQDSSNRLEIKLRVVEGHYGNIQAFIIPRISPKTCQACVYRIKPLCLQQRVQKVDDKKVLNELKITGSFSLAEMHAWVAFCLPEVPSRAPGDEVTYCFESVLLKTILICKYKAGEGVFRSDSITTLAILKEGITKEATARKTRITLSFDLKEECVTTFMHLMDPKLQFQLSLTKKMQMIEALKEVKMQEEDVSFLDPSYLEILENADQVEKLFKQQPRQLEYLHGIVKDLFIDYHKFKGSNVKHRVPQLEQHLNNYDLEAILQFMLMPGQ